MNYKDFTLGDWIGHISGVIEDESELDGNEMRDLVEFLTTLTQEPCEDAVSRQAVLDTLDKMDSVLDEDRTVETYKELLAACYKDLPSVTSAHKMGKWIYSGSYDVEGVLYCSNCKHEIDVSEGYFKFCPNCGAEMEGEE